MPSYPLTINVSGAPYADAYNQNTDSGPMVACIVTGGTGSVASQKWNSSNSAFFTAIGSNTATTIYIETTATTVYASVKVLFPFMNISAAGTTGVALTISTPRTVSLSISGYADSNIPSDTALLNRLVTEDYADDMDSYLTNTRSFNSINARVNNADTQFIAIGMEENYSNLRFLLSGYDSRQLVASGLWFKGSSSAISHTSPGYTVEWDVTQVRVRNQKTANLEIMYCTFYVKRSSTYDIWDMDSSTSVPSGQYATLYGTDDSPQQGTVLGMYLDWYFQASPMSNYKITVTVGGSTLFTSQVYTMSSYSASWYPETTLSADQLMSGQLLINFGNA